MNRLLAHLKPQAEPLTEADLDEQDAKAKKDRIQHHRDKVRNGPVKMTTWTTGQVRRAVDRQEATRHRKVNRRFRRDFIAKQHVFATLRGHLVILGVVECQREGWAASNIQQQESAVWVIRKFGLRDEETGELVESEDLLSDAVHAARKAYLEVAKPVKA